MQRANKSEAAPKQHPKIRISSMQASRAFAVLVTAATDIISAFLFRSPEPFRYEASAPYLQQNDSFEWMHATLFKPFPF